MAVEQRAARAQFLEQAFGRKFVHAQLRENRLRGRRRIRVVDDRAADDDVVRARGVRFARRRDAPLIAVRAAARTNPGTEREKSLTEDRLEAGDFRNRGHDAGTARIARQRSQAQRVLGRAAGQSQRRPSRPARDS